MNRRRVLRMLGQSTDWPKPEANDVVSGPVKEPETGHKEDTSQEESQPEADTFEHIPKLSRFEMAEMAEQQAPKPESESDLDEMEALERWDPMGEHYRSPLNTVTIDPDKEPESVITGKMAEGPIMIGNRKVCNHYLKYGCCADRQYCSRIHVSSASKDKIHLLEREYNMNTGRTRLVSSHLSPVMHEPDDTALILVSISMIETPTRFYFVAPYDKMNFASFDRADIEFYIGRVQQSSSLKIKLQKCHEHLASLFGHNYRVDNVTQIIANGQVVACKLEDGRFCRAIVRGLDRDDIGCLYELFLIDYGKTVQLPRESVYEIRTSCLSEPPMSILSRLELRPARNSLSWPQESMSCFEDFIAKNEYLLCKIIGYRQEDDLFTVDLLDLDKKASLTSEMLAKNLAERMVL